MAMDKKVIVFKIGVLSSEAWPTGLPHGEWPYIKKDIVFNIGILEDGGSAHWPAKREMGIKKGYCV